MFEKIMLAIALYLGIKSIDTGTDGTDTQTDNDLPPPPPPTPALPVFQIYDIIESMPLNNSKPYPHRPVSLLTHVIFHHSLTTSGTPYAYGNYHILEHNWPGIAYDFVIDKDGTIYATKPLDKRGYHVGNMNTQSIGVCLTGNYDIETPPDAQLEAAAWLYRHLATDPALPYLTYGYHNEYSPKSCPGNLFPYGEFGLLIEAYMDEVA